MPKISAFLWFDTQAEEAAHFYCEIFPRSKIGAITRYPKGAAQKPAGTDVMTVTFELDGREFVALNGGPHFKFTEAVSFAIECATQAEIDNYWNKLIAGGGKESQCGWLTDKYGLSWQVVPKKQMEMIADADPAKVKRVFDAMLTMKKLDLAALERAYKGG